MAQRPHQPRKRYYDPGSQPQSPHGVIPGGPVVIAKVTRQLRRQAKTDPQLAAFVIEHDRRAHVDALRKAHPELLK